MKTFKFTVKEKSAISNSYNDNTYSLKADNIEEAVERFYKGWGFKWSRDKIKEFIQNDK